MASLVLFASSLSALILLVIHSARRRGWKVTAVFFLAGAVFGVARGNLVYLVCQYLSRTGTGSTPYLPQGNLLPHIGHESLQVVIGWMFAGYLAWTLSEFVLRRIRWEDRLFPTVALSALFMCCISYCMETTAPRIGWWYWDMSTVNPLFGSVPYAGIAAWFSIAVDFIFPVLLIACSEYRRSPWTWLTVLIFPAHMGAHALYQTFPYIDEIYVVLALTVVGLGLFNRTRLETGFVRRPANVRAGFVDFIPGVAVATFLAIILRADLMALGEIELAFTAIPLLVFSLLAAPRIPAVVVLIVAALGVAAWPWVGFRALYSFAPLLAFGVLVTLDRAKECGTAAPGCDCLGRKGPSRGRLGHLVGLGWMGAALVLAAVFVAGEESDRYTMNRYTDLLRKSWEARMRGLAGPASGYRKQALAMKFDSARDLWWSLNFLRMVSMDDIDSMSAEARKRYPMITRMDPRWTSPWIEWAGWLVVDGEIEEAVEKCRQPVRFEPTMGSHHAILGYLLLRDGQVEEAGKELSEAIRLGANDRETRINLAVVCAARGDAVRAGELLAEVLAEDPEHPVARLDMRRLEESPLKLRADLDHIAAPEKFAFLGLLMEQRAQKKDEDGDLPSAVRLMKEALHFAPRVGSIHANYAITLARAGGTLEEAVQQCEQGLRLDPGMDDARRNLVRLYIKLARKQTEQGEKDAARATLQRALPRASGAAFDQIQRMLRDLASPNP
jgi:Flp pilus assembly protein TadD